MMESMQPSRGEAPPGMVETEMTKYRDLSDLTVLIVTYNSHQEIRALLRDLQALDGSENFEILIIDNASNDGSAEVARNSCPDARVIQNTENTGYSRAVNQGIREIATDFVFLLNPDIRIHQPETLTRLYAVMERSKEIGAVGPLQIRLSEKGERLTFGWSFYTPRGIWMFIQHLCRKRLIYRRPITSPFLNAGCLLLRRSAYVRVSGLDERYFMYGEEPDLFLKFMRHGIKARLHPGVLVVHHRERSIKTLPHRQRVRLKLLSGINVWLALNRGGFKTTVSLIQRSWSNIMGQKSIQA
jgi:N-acetylglucosaminyl-diphospho-decaprenol L-rhamnosyltransferase